MQSENARIEYGQVQEQPVMAQTIFNMADNGCS